MNAADAHRVIQSRFIDLWVHTIVSVRNDYYDPPSDVAEWVRIAINESSTENIGLGAALANGPGARRHFGDIVVEIHVRPKTGEVRAKELAVYVADIFENQAFDNVKCWETDILTIGATDDRAWFLVSANTFFHYEVIAA